MPKRQLANLSPDGRYGVQPLRWVQAVARSEELIKLLQKVILA